MKNNKNILIIDNYDSFTYNLLHLVNECGASADVWRNDQFALDAVDAFDSIILSPGPGIPEEAGLLLNVIRRYAPTKKIFGVCLGQQAIWEAFGGSLVNLSEPLHGIATPIFVDQNEVLFKDCPPHINAGRYHSWVVNRETTPSCFKVVATDADEEIMAIRHTTLDVVAVQFHPESILTEHGKQMMQNWICS